MGKPSRDKGKRGEREAAALLSTLIAPAIRGQQRSGLEQADVVFHDPSVDSKLHIEVKRYKRIVACDFMDQAKEDSGGKLPVVLMRQDGDEWILSIPAKRLHELGDLLEHVRGQ